MASVTLSFSSLTERQMRDVLLAHHREHDMDSQPSNLATGYAREHDGGKVGCIVRAEGPEVYSVITMPLNPASAMIVASALTP